MTIPLPSAEVSVLKGGLGVASAGVTNVHVSISPSSKGPLKQPVAFSQPEDAFGTFGCGPMTKGAAYGAKSRAPYIAIRVPAVAEAAVVSTITKPTGKTVTVTGTPLWGYDVILVFTTGGTIGTSASYQYSLDGGVTYTAIATLGVATTISLAGTGLTVNLTAAQVYATNDTITFWVKPASQLISPVTVTRVDSSTSVITATGTPEDEYDLVFEVIAGGTIGTSGITFRYSLDGGETWSPTTGLGTATTYLLNDGSERTGYESSGVTLNFAAGTLDAGDKAALKTTGPAFQASDVNEALDVLRASSHKFVFLHLPADATAAKAASIGGKLDTLAAQGVFCYAVMSARDRNDGEIDSTGQPSVIWAERLITEYANLASDRLAVGAGRARITCPITGRTNRRPASWVAVARLVEKTIQVDPGRVRDGALSSDVRIFNAAGMLSELDSNVRSALHGARFLTLRRHDELTGVYIARGNAMAGPGSEYNRIALRAVIDLASRVYKAVMLQQIENNLLANPLSGVKPDGSSVFPGSLAEPDARIVDRELNTALRTVLVSAGYVSGVTARVRRDNNFLSTGELLADVSITPVGYVDTFKGTIAFENPKFAALAA